VESLFADHTDQTWIKQACILTFSQSISCVSVVDCVNEFVFISMQLHYGELRSMHTASN